MTAENVTDLYPHTNPTGDAETALLGALLDGYPDIPAIARTITGADFWQPAHEAIWDAINAVHAAGHKPDRLLVKDHLGKAAERLPGGALYLFDLEAPIASQAPLYAAQVRTASVRRKVTGLGQRLTQAADEYDDPDELLQQSREWLDQLATVGHDDGTLSATDAIEQVIEVLQNGAPNGHPTWLADLTDALGGGWMPGRLYTIGARPSVGKSIAGENAAAHVAKLGSHALIVSMEMSAMELMQRTIAHEAAVDLTLMQKKMQAERADLWDKVSEATARVMQWPIRYLDTPGITIHDIRAAAWAENQAARRAGSDLGIVVVDYVQLINNRDGNKYLSRQQELGLYTRALKRLAKELECPVVMLAQVNRAAAQAGRPPTMSDLRESGDIENDSDVIILLHEDPELPGDIDFIIDKNRHGAKKTLTFQKWGHYAQIR